MPRRSRNNEAFNRAFQTGARLGGAGFLQAERSRIDLEKFQQQQRQKVAKENQQRDALLQIIGVPTPKPIASNVGGELTPEQSQTKEALLFSELSTGGRLAANRFLEQREPAKISDTYFNVTSKFVKNKEGEAIGGLYGFNKETGKEELITENPNLVPSPVGRSFTIKGVQEIDGELVGTVRETSVVERMNNFRLRVTSVGKTEDINKYDKQVAHEYSMGIIQDDNDKNIKTAQQFRLKVFSSPADVDAFEIGVNSRFAALSLRVGKLGTPEVKQEILDIVKRGRELFNRGVAFSRQKFYEMEKERVLNNNNWNFQEGQVLLKFLEFRYKNFIESGDPKMKKDEMFSDEQVAKEISKIEGVDELK